MQVEEQGKKLKTATIKHSKNDDTKFKSRLEKKIKTKKVTNYIGLFQKQMYIFNNPKMSQTFYHQWQYKPVLNLNDSYCRTGTLLIQLYIKVTDITKIAIIFRKVNQEICQMFLLY